MDMLNDVAKKLVARVARSDIKGYRDRIALGASADDLAVEAWDLAKRHNPDFATWRGAKEYFEAVFLRELGD
jgi:hypothetical protein